MMRRIAIIGILVCLAAVAIGAFGAHALSDLLKANQREAVFDLANRYQFYHGLGIIALACLGQLFNLNLKIASVLMLVGTIIFSGSLYLLATLNIPWLGAITPIGGVLLISAWGLAAWKLSKGS